MWRLTELMMVCSTHGVAYDTKVYSTWLLFFCNFFFFAHSLRLVALVQIFNRRRQKQLIQNIICILDGVYIWYNKARVDKTNCNERNLYKKEYFVHFADWFVSRERETLMCVTTTTITYLRSSSKRVKFNNMCAPSTDTHKYTRTYTQLIEKLDQNPFEYCSFSFSLLFFSNTLFSMF